MLVDRLKLFCSGDEEMETFFSRLSTATGVDAARLVTAVRLGNMKILAFWIQATTTTTTTTKNTCFSNNVQLIYR